MNIDHQIVVVDDNSPDGTAAVVSKLASRYKNIILVKRSGKLGIATAIRDGMLASSSNYVVVMDSDLQHPPEVVPKILKELKKGNDIAIASRYIRGGKSEFNILRKLVSKAATLLAHMNLQETEGVMDPMSGFFGFKRELIEPEAIKSDGYKVLLEILVASQTKNIVEVPYRFNKRATGKSKFGTKELIRYVKLLLNLSDYLMIKFLIVGISGAILNLLLVRLIVGGFHDPLYAGAIIALEASILSNFVFNNYWTYRNKRGNGSLLRKYARYNLMSSLGSAIYFAMIFLLIAFSVNYMIATGIGIIASFSTNFSGSPGAAWHL